MTSEILTTLVEKYEILTEKQREGIQNAMAMLFKKSFLLRSEDKTEYQYLTTYSRDIVKPLLSMIGFTFNVSAEYGVIGLNGENSNFLQETFGRNETALILILRDLYSEKIKKEITKSLSTTNVFITKEDLLDKAEIFGIREQIKTCMTKALKKCQQHNLIKIGNNGLITILPSIRFAVDDEEINKSFDKIRDFMLKNAKNDEVKDLFYDDGETQEIKEEN